MRPLLSEQPSDRGFTLIEILISVLVFSIGVLAICQLHGSSHKGNFQANRLTLANSLAENIIETLMQLPFDDPNLDEGIQGPQAADRYWVGWEVTDDIPLDPLVQDTNGQTIDPYTISKTIDIVIFTNNTAFNDASGNNRILTLSLVKTRSL